MKNLFRKPQFVICIAFYFLVFLNYSINAQTPSSNFLEAIPQVEEKLNSDNLFERVKVLNDLVTDKRDYDVIETILPYNLLTTDYVFVIKKIFEKDLTKLDEKIIATTFYKIEFLVKKFKLKKFAKDLVLYLPKYTANSEQDYLRIGLQIGIIDTIKSLKAKEFSSNLIPLLQSPIKNLKRETLSTLVELRAREAVPTLINILNDKDINQKFYALQSLVKVDGKIATPNIAKLLDDESMNIRFWALDALVKLEAIEFVPNIRNFLDTNKLYKEGAYKNSAESLLAESYATAILIKFGEPKAISVFLDCFTKENELCGETLRFIVELKATAIIPTLLRILKKNKEYSIKENEYIDFRFGIIKLLYDLGNRDSISVSILRKVLRDKKLEIMDVTIELLKNYKSKESVDELLFVLREHLPNFGKKMCNDSSRVTCNNYDYLANDAALALAKIGDKKTWKELIDLVENSPTDFSNRSKIIQELNRNIDTELWKKINSRKVSRFYVISIKTIIDSYNKETGIPITLEFEPGKDASKQSSIPGGRLSPDGYPWGNIAGDIPLIFGLKEVVLSISYGTEPENFTFIFDNGKIRILTVEKAVEWWRKNILK